MDTDESPLSGAVGGVFRSILVGYDGSAGAQDALRIAKALAADVHGVVHVLQVIRSPAHAETSEGLAKAARAELGSFSHGLTSVAGTASVAIHVVFGDDPATTIVEFAAEHGVDLVVTGSHGREQTLHRGLGHSLEALLRQRSCPVLVV